MSETPITDAVHHNVPELAMMCRKLERDLRKCEAGAAVMREAHEKIAEIDRDAEYQSFALTRFQAAQLSRAALAKRPVIVDTSPASKKPTRASSRPRKSR